MNADEMAEEFIMKIVWSLERILKDEYRETFNPDGTLASLELDPQINFERDGLTSEALEHYFARILPPEKLDALLCLKEGRTAADVEKVIHILLSSKLAVTALASQTADELAEVDWQEFLLFLYQQFAFSRELGKNFGEVMITEREGFSTPFGRDVEAYLEERRPGDLGLFTARKYAEELRQIFPQLVERAGGLRLLPISQTLPADLQTYLVEASRCYLYGHFFAGLVLCRSAIEYGVKERLRLILSDEDAQAIDDFSVAKLIRLARDNNLLDGARFKAAHEIRELARTAVHRREQEELPTVEQCSDALVQTRGILGHLYE